MKRLFAATVIVGLGISLAWQLMPISDNPQPDMTTAPAPTTTDPRPWRYGKPDARFTLTEFADLECPYCQAYFPVLRQWIDDHPEVNWQWHYLPLSGPDSASPAARLVECAGATAGERAYWKALEWAHANPQAPDKNRQPPSWLMTPPVKDCLGSSLPKAAIQRQAAEAVLAGIAVTPTLRLLDHHTGKTLILHGPIAGDALLSAVDLLVASASKSPTAHNPNDADFEMPADAVSDMPR
jgi:protein-disulfide isomerase